MKMKPLIISSKQIALEFIVPCNMLKTIHIYHHLFYMNDNFRRPKYFMYYNADDKYNYYIFLKTIFKNDYLYFNNGVFEFVLFPYCRSRIPIILKDTTFWNLNQERDCYQLNYRGMFEIYKLCKYS